MKLTWVLCCLALGCAGAPVTDVFSGQRDHGDKPGVGIELRFVRGLVEGGTFSIIAPEGMAEIEGTDRLDYPMQVLSQKAGTFTFRVDLLVGSETQPFVYDAWWVLQADGTVHVSIDDAGAKTPRDQLGPPFVLERARR